MEKQNKRISLTEAAALVKDGSTLSFSGFTIWRRPMALVFELIRQKRRHLHLLEVNGGPQTEFLVGAGCVDVWESCWVGHELYGKYGANLSRKVGNKEMIVEDYSHADTLREYFTEKSCAPYCTISCVHQVSVLDRWRDPQTRAFKPEGSGPLVKVNTLR